MNGRLIKTKTKKKVFLFPDGKIVAATNELLQSLLFDFRSFNSRDWSGIGEWKSNDDPAPNMFLVPGKTLAYITDDRQLVICDDSIYRDVFQPTITDLISCYEFGAMHNVNPEYVRVLCRTGRIAGARKVSGAWMVPKNALYPISAERRRKDLTGVAGRPRNSERKNDSKEK